MRRLADFSAISTALALRSDRHLLKMVDEAEPAGAGIGGTRSLMEVEGRRVFVKRVPLTERERDNPHETANLFDLPAYYQYGVGSAGFGVWRELAAHVMTTNWAIAGEWDSVPLLYHWRVLPGSPPPWDRKNLEPLVERWHGSPQIRQRLEAILAARASVVLFLEYVPQSVEEWLVDHELGPQQIEALYKGLKEMNKRGLYHFDAHFRNLLIDGEQLYFADFGLATSPRFELSVAEREFLEQNETYDRAYARTFVANRLARNEPIADVMNGFFRRLREESRMVPYPGEEVRALLARCGDA